MTRNVATKLKVLREFQEKYPMSHVGGSIGLMLRGIDLKRSMEKSDLDITIDSYDFDSNVLSGLEERSDTCDFDFSLKKTDSQTNWYVKIDIRISPEPGFDVINFKGAYYNVSKLQDILFWKKKYADKGVKKHKDDLVAIHTGVRPEITIGDKQLEPKNQTQDSLPF